MKAAIKWIISCVVLHNLLADLKDQWNELYKEEEPKLAPPVGQENDDTSNDGLQFFTLSCSPPPPLLPPPGPASLQRCASPQAPLFLPPPPRGPPETLSPLPGALCNLRRTLLANNTTKPLANISLLPSTSQARPAERSQLRPTTSRPQPADCSLLPPTTSRPQPADCSLLPSASRPQPANRSLLPPPTGRPQPANCSLLPSTSQPQTTAANCLVHPCRLDHGRPALPAAAAHRLLPAGCRPLLAERSLPTAPCCRPLTTSQPQPANRSLLPSARRPQPANCSLLPPPTGRPQPANRSLLPSTSQPQPTALSTPAVWITAAKRSLLPASTS
ncbi:hypothetical protein PCASD_07464 [Puccinia coronata f. sp. avenae]|uniref:Uncharacterized protein n=1 Tax=Puccinia coronata f. sp. avenae TaxID=200324 RepID=A0A2N5TGG7_9BASI|nr:hypothetical protein PCASD_07464 [Puccinia coronata f. sp. avenae]